MAAALQPLVPRQALGSPGQPHPASHGGMSDPSHLFPSGLGQHPLLQVLQLAQLASSLPAPQSLPAAGQLAGPPLPPYFPAAAPPAHAPAPPPAFAPPATSGTSSDRDRLARPAGDATAELEAAVAANSNVAGLKLPVSCNDIRGVVYLDQQVVACYCPTCEQRVAGGHGRPLFSFTRFERHSGSKAKKWRLSIRIDPGAVKEAPADEPPLALGQWLESKGLVSWAPRGGLKIGPSGGGGGAGGGSSDEEGSPLYGEDSAGAGRRAFQPSAVDRRQATIGPRPSGPADGPVAGSSGGQQQQQQQQALGKRGRQDYETPDLPSHADRQQWLDSQRAAFEAVVVSGEQPSGSAAAAGPEADGNSLASDSSQSRQQRSRSSAQHGAIFGLVYGLLDDGEDRRSFNEQYLPWLNDLPRERLDAEFTTLHNYLQMLRSGMAHETVRGLMSAYVRAVIAKASGAH